MLIWLYGVMDLGYATLNVAFLKFCNPFSFIFFKIVYVCAQARVVLQEKLQNQLCPCGLTLTSIKFISKHGARIYGRLRARVHI